MSNEILRSSLVQIRNLLKNNKISAEELLDLCHKRINDTNYLNVFNSVVKPKSYIPSSQKSSPLKGIPFSVKDNFNTEDIPTTCSSIMLENYIPNYNATIVEKLLTSGGSLVGKDNMDEFAMGSGGCESAFGPAKNPWNIDILMDEGSDDFYVPGGSSGGSAAAVASGSTFFSIGSDTGGSVRVPASFCGVVGLKPTYGALSRYGLIPLCNSLDVPGIFTRSVEDAAFVFNLLKGKDGNDPTTIQKYIPDVRCEEEEKVEGLTVGIPKEHKLDSTDKGIKEYWMRSIDQFADAGANIVEVSLPHTEYAQPTYRVLCCADVASNMARFDGVEYGYRSREGSTTEQMYTLSRDEAFSEKVKRRIGAGNFFLLEENYDRFFGKALRLRRLIRQDFARVFGHYHDNKVQDTSRACDVLLTPTTSVTSPLYSRFMTVSDLGCGHENDHHDLAGMPEVDYHVTSVNIASLPAISVPVGLTPNKHGHLMPVGLQLISWEMEEQTLLKSAKFLEQMNPFKHLLIG